MLGLERSQEVPPLALSPEVQKQPAPTACPDPMSTLAGARLAGPHCVVWEGGIRVAVLLSLCPMHVRAA